MMALRSGVFYVASLIAQQEQGGRRPAADVREDTI
jgi:hypothetical protein